ncbi:hypothetical protein GR28A_00167 [Vibrio phage vB_VcorM_GR28A]|nr:hypothetical protein GR28A_00167 [Vibrio phage vB_VcorM_GR28A]
MRGDKFHVGVPIGGVIIMTLSETLPENFHWMDGSQVSESRSRLNGITTPNWNNKCFLGIGVGSGAIVNSSVNSDTKTYSLKATDIPVMEPDMDWNVDFKASGSSALQGADYSDRRTDDTDALDQPSLRRGMNDWNWDGGSARSGDDTNHLITSKDYDKGEGESNLSHTHNIDLNHDADHVLEAQSSSTDYLLSFAESAEYTLAFDSTMTTSRGQALQYQSVPNHFNVRYAMRLY